MIVFDPTKAEPNWAPGAADYLATLLRPTDVVVEWGSGQSTQWLASRVGKVVAIEHDPAWAAYTRRLCATRRNVVVVMVDQFGASYLWARDVAREPGRRVWIIDGWQRRECLDLALTEARPGDIVVADDALDYARGLDLWGLRKFAMPHPHAETAIAKAPTISIYDTHPQTKETWVWEMATVTIITPTGDRARALGLCARWMARQTYQGPVQWLIVDDGLDSFVPEFRRPKWTVEHVRRDGAPPSARSLAANVRAGLQHAKGDLVIIIEDDDWYSPDHLADLVNRLKSADATGSGLQRYYHAPSRLALQLTNKGSCLAQTGFRRSLIPLMDSACARCLDDGSRGVDARFWEAVRHRPDDIVQDVYTDGAATCIGMKGLPGRPGLGIGHRPAEGGHPWQADPDLTQLREWIGDDVDVYRQFSPEPAKEAAAP